MRKQSLGNQDSAKTMNETSDGLDQLRTSRELSKLRRRWKRERCVGLILKTSCVIWFAMTLFAWWFDDRLFRTMLRISLLTIFVTILATMWWIAGSVLYEYLRKHNIGKMESITISLFTTIGGALVILAVGSL